MDREQFAKQFIEKGQASGASKEEVSAKLQMALNDYDKKFGGQTQQPETEPSYLGDIATAIVKPAKDYGNMVLGAGYEGYRSVKSAMGDQNAYGSVNPETGKWEDKANPFLNQEEINQFSDPKQASLEGTKRAVGMSSYFMPSSLTGSVAAGSLYALSQTDDDATVDEYVKNALIGGVGGVAGYGVSVLGGKILGKLTDKVKNLMTSQPRISEETANKAAQQIIGKAENVANKEYAGTTEAVYGSGFPFSKKGSAFEKLKPQETFKTMIEDEVWGKPESIIRKTNMVTGDDGVLTNIVRHSFDEAGSSIEIPRDLIDLEDVTGVFTTLSKDDVLGLTSRLGKAAPGSTVTGKDANALFKFQKDLENEAWDVLSSTTKSGKTTEFAQLKLVMAKRIENVLDNAVKNNPSSSNLAKDPAIIAYLEKYVSTNLARKVANSNGDLRILRSLQKDYLNMNRIAKLSQQENSALGKKLFGWIDKVPAVGPIISAVSSQAEAALGSGTAVMSRKVGQRSSQIMNPIRQGVSQIGQSTVDSLNSLAPIAGAELTRRGLGKTPPSL